MRPRIDLSQVLVQVRRSREGERRGGERLAKGKGHASGLAAHVVGAAAGPA